MDDLQPGCMEFNIETACPNFQGRKIEDVLGAAAIMISVAYEGQEFWRVGFYVVNEVMGELNK